MTSASGGVGATVEWLSHFQPEELREVLKRWNLPAGVTHDEQLATVEAALRSEQVPVRAPDQLEAMRRMTDFDLEEQKEFLRRCGLPVGGNQIQVLQKIEQNLGPQGVPIDTAFDYIDELHENGGQHLFLFRLDKGRAAYLRTFEDRSQVLERVRRVRSLPDDALGDRGPVRDELYKPLSRNALFFETKIESSEPVLVATYWRELPRPALFLKWVATREWHQVVQAGANPKRLELRERSASYFRLDLQNGEAELRVQRLHPNPRRPLRDEYELLRRQIGQFLELDAFLPVLVEPAIRRLLTSTDASVVRWQVSWTDSGILGGGVDPAMVQSLFRRFKNYSAVALVADWLYEEDGATRSVQAKLDALTNEVLFLKRCTAHEMLIALSDIRRGASARLRAPHFDDMAREREEWRPILQQIERSIGGAPGTKEIDLRRMARESWIDEARVFAVAQQLQAAYPNLFELRLSARCPETGRQAVGTEGPVTFVGLAEIAGTFRCRHDQPRRWEEHATAGNVHVVLIVRPEPSQGALLERLQPRVEAWFGISAARVYMNMLALLLFTVLYLGVVLLTAASFLKLRQLFGGGTAVAATLAAPFGLVMLLLAGVVVKLLGGPVTRTAISALEHLTALFDPRRGRREPAAWSADVHAIPKEERLAEPETGVAPEAGLP
jgi:hypothetical protein